MIKKVRILGDDTQSGKNLLEMDTLEIIKLTKNL